jgi:hypothetical protein
MLLSRTLLIEIAFSRMTNRLPQRQYRGEFLSRGEPLVHAPVQYNLSGVNPVRSSRVDVDRTSRNGVEAYFWYFFLTEGAELADYRVAAM